jgi:hypothetical protein
LVYRNKAVGNAERANKVPPLAMPHAGCLKAGYTTESNRRKKAIAGQVAAGERAGYASC